MSQLRQSRQAPLRALAFTLSLMACCTAVHIACIAPASARRRPASRKVDKKTRKRAKKLFERAEKAYNLARFQKALALYSKAYELLPMAGFLFNIGQCHRMLGNFKRALFFYKGYLRGGKNIANRKLVLQLIKKTQKKLAEKKHATPTPNTGQQRGATRAGGQLRTGGRTGGAAKDGKSNRPDFMPPPTTPKRKKRARPVYKKWWFWTVIGVGAALVAGAVTGGVLAANRGDESEPPSGTLGVVDLR
jgi:tetratricopeptide (TPR) repeat protein